ncbi:hypothetical protein HZ994_13420 [Akkermansiaceae bacterium]|nr:hypothetical protein HZ994_13420 [Akkermansiaceae bacterium]
MARRRQTDSGGGINLDSLMDALTNVVAVLILVLILVQADVSQKVQQFLDDMIPATPEMIAAMKEQITLQREQEKKLEAAMKQDAPSPARIEEEKRQLALLEKSLEENKAALADLEKLREIEATVKAEREKESKITGTIQTEIARVEGLLDSIPAPAADTPTVVNIPNSRPIPDDATKYHAMAIKGRIHVIDPNAVMKVFTQEFSKRRNDWLHRRIKIKGKADRFIYDGQKIAAFFKDYDWGNFRGQKIEIIANPKSYRLQLSISPDLVNGGTPTDQLATPGSPYSKAAATILGDFRAVLLFQVATDSFDTYLEARRLADKANIAAGWEINGNTKFTMRIEEPEIHCLEPAPPAKPGQPSPPKPPPLKPKLD